MININELQAFVNALSNIKITQTIKSIFYNFLHTFILFAQYLFQSPLFDYSLCHAKCILDASVELRRDYWRVGVEESQFIEPLLRVIGFVQ